MKPIFPQTKELYSQLIERALHSETVGGKFLTELPCCCLCKALFDFQPVLAMVGGSLEILTTI